MSIDTSPSSQEMCKPPSTSYLYLWKQSCFVHIRRALFVGYGTRVSLIARCTRNIIMLMARFLLASIVGGKQASMMDTTT